MLGQDVQKANLDMKSAEALIELRRAFRRIETIGIFLANLPSGDGGDPLIIDFGYTEDEAYVMRVVFEQLNTARLEAQDTMALTRKITGLD